MLYSTLLAQQQAHSDKINSQMPGQVKVKSSQTPGGYMWMPQGMLDGTDHTKYYNAAQTWRAGGRQGTYTPPNLSKGETQGKIDTGPVSSKTPASSSPSAGSSSGVRQVLPAQPTPDQPSLNVPQPSGSVNYQTSIGVGPAADPDRIRSLVNTAQQVDAGSETGDRAVDDYTRSMNMNNQAQMDMAVQGANSQQLMNSQQKRSESSISGINDQAAIYNDSADRFRQALGLSTNVDAAKMSYDYGIQANNIRRLQNIGRNNP